MECLSTMHMTYNTPKEKTTGVFLDLLLSITYYHWVVCIWQKHFLIDGLLSKRKDGNMTKSKAVLLCYFQPEITQLCFIV